MAGLNMCRFLASHVCYLYSKNLRWCLLTVVERRKEKNIDTIDDLVQMLQLAHSNLYLKELSSYIMFVLFSHSLVIGVRFVYLN